MKMSIHRALGELKLYDKKVLDLICGSFIAVANKKADKINGVARDEATKKMIANLDSVTAIFANRKILKSAIAESNVNTTVMVGGETMTVLDAIERKAYVNTERSLLLNLKSKMNQCVQSLARYEEDSKAALERQLSALAKQQGITAELIEATRNNFIENNTIELVDPNHLSEFIDKFEAKLDQFSTEVDYVLSESNSQTFIDVELNGIL